MTHAPLFGEGDLGFGVAVKVVQLALHEVRSCWPHVTLGPCGVLPVAYLHGTERALPAEWMEIRQHDSNSSRPIKSEIAQKADGYARPEDPVGHLRV